MNVIVNIGPYMYIAGARSVRLWSSVLKTHAWPSQRQHADKARWCWKKWLEYWTEHHTELVKYWKKSTGWRCTVETTVIWVGNTGSKILGAYPSMHIPWSTEEVNQSTPSTFRSFSCCHRGKCSIRNVVHRHDMYCWAHYDERKSSDPSHWPNRPPVQHITHIRLRGAQCPPRQRKTMPPKGAITSKIKHAIKHKTNPARLAQHCCSPR